MKLFGWELSKDKANEKRFDPLNPLTGNTSVFNTYQGVGKIDVNETSALRLSAVWACVRTISNSLATLPSNYYQRDSKGNSIIAINIAGQKVIKNPNEYMSSFSFKIAMIIAKLLHGNGYAFINRDTNGWPTSIIPIHPSRVEVKAEKGEVFYLVDSKRYEATDILHFKGPSIDGLVGLSTIKYEAQNIGLALSSQNELKNFYEKGSKLDGFISYPNKFDSTVKTKTEDAFAKKHSGDDAKKVAVFDNGAKYVPVGVNPSEAMWLEMMNYGVRDIARIFGVPPHLIQDLQNSTNNNIEHQGMDFVNHCLLPHAKEFEEELDRKLLLEFEKPNHYFKFNMNGLLRGDSSARAELYRALFAAGAISPNEIRRLEEMNGYEEGDNYYIQLNQIDISKSSEYFMSSNKKEQRNEVDEVIENIKNGKPILK